MLEVLFLGVIVAIILIIPDQWLRRYLLKFKKPLLEIDGDYVKVDYEYIPDRGIIREYDSVFIPTDDAEKLAKEIESKGDRHFQYNYGKFDYPDISHCRILKIEIYHHSGYIHYPLALQIASFLGLEVNHNMDVKTIINMIADHIKYNPLPRHNHGFEESKKHFNES